MKSATTRPSKCVPHPASVGAVLIPRAKASRQSKAEQSHKDRIAAMPCALCEVLGQIQQGGTFVHHIREGQGASQRADDFLAIPLCYECHQGDDGIHGSRALLKVAKVSELDLLALTIRKLMEPHD